jgi:hypothetical protein
MVLKDFNNIKDAKVEIAQISFAYDNKKLMDLLVKRGSILQKSDINKIAALDKEILELTKQEDIIKFKRPVSCYITFNT